MPPSPDALRAQVWAALGRVLDPDLGEPVTQLGFVRLEVHPGDGCREAHAVIELTLPAGNCPPYLAWLMCGGLQEAAESTPGVGSAEVRLPDRPQPGAWATADFRARAHAAAQLRLVTALTSRGLTLDDVALITLGGAGRLASRQVDAVARHRRALGLAGDDTAPAVLDEAGRPVPPAGFARWRRRAELSAVTVRGDAAACSELGRRYSRDGRG